MENETKLFYLTMLVAVLSLITYCTDSPTVSESPPSDAAKPLLKSSRDVEAAQGPGVILQDDPAILPPYCWTWECPDERHARKDIQDYIWEFEYWYIGGDPSNPENWRSRTIKWEWERWTFDDEGWLWTCVDQNRYEHEDIPARFYSRDEMNREIEEWTVEKGWEPIPREGCINPWNTLQRGIGLSWGEAPFPPEIEKRFYPKLKTEYKTQYAECFCQN